MTKEEIIWGHTANEEYPSYYHESDIEQMMEEYAKQQAIAFAEWLDKGWESISLSEYEGKYSGERKSTSELHTLFLQSL